MNYLWAVRILVVMLVCILSAPGARAQRVETKVENAEVVYVEENDIVIKSTSGEVRQFEIPDSSTFAIDGKAVTVHELKPGMKLTATIITASAPRLVDEVSIIELGTVWQISGSNLIIKKPDGENKAYRVPSGQKITLDGKEIALDQLQEGDKITATVITTRAPLEGEKATPAVHRTPVTPPRVGVLLIDEVGKSVEPNSTSRTPAIILLIVVILVIAVVILLVFRRKWKA